MISLKQKRITSALLKLNKYHKSRQENEEYKELCRLIMEGKQLDNKLNSISKFENNNDLNNEYNSTQNEGKRKLRSNKK